MALAGSTAVVVESSSAAGSQERRLLSTAECARRRKWAGAAIERWDERKGGQEQEEKIGWKKGGAHSSGGGSVSLSLSRSGLGVSHSLQLQLSHHRGRRKTVVENWGGRGGAHHGKRKGKKRDGQPATPTGSLGTAHEVSRYMYLDALAKRRSTCWDRGSVRERAYRPAPVGR